MMMTNATNINQDSIENNMALLLVVRVKIILYLLAIDFYPFIVLT